MEHSTFSCINVKALGDLGSLWLLIRQCYTERSEKKLGCVHNRTHNRQIMQVTQIIPLQILEAAF